MSHFYVIVISLLVTELGCNCQRANQFILTCGGGGDEPVRGAQGPPGKRGPPGIVGPRGVQGPKGEPGANNTLENEFRRLEAKMEAMETKLQSTSVSVSHLKLTSCKDALDKGFNRSGVYFFYDPVYYQGYWDMETDGGGWLVIQKRFDGSTEFYRDWTEYEKGFGSLTGEFWAGLELMHELTSWKRQELRVDLQNFDNTEYYAKYSNFSIGSSANRYRLTVGGYSGNAGDWLDIHNQMPFTTRDRDSRGCAVRFHGAWWYNLCHKSNLNGKYYKGETRADDSNKWYPVSRKRSEMKIRPVM